MPECSCVQALERHTPRLGRMGATVLAMAKQTAYLLCLFCVFLMGALLGMVSRFV